MKNTESVRNIIAAAAVSLGLAVAASAAVPVGDGMEEPVAGVSLGGLLGQTYASATYSFVNFDDTDVNANMLRLEANQAVEAGLDTFVGAEALRSDSFSNGRLSSHQFDAGARFYRTYQGVKPFWEFGAGWLWQKAPFGFSDSTFVWRTSLGAEIQLTRSAAVAPYVQYADAIDFQDGDSWHYGVRGDYWLNDRTALNAAVVRADHESWLYRLGVNFRY